MKFLKLIASNVKALTKLADFYNATTVMTLCERHLLCCIEIPLIDRFLLAEKYKLKATKVVFE